MAIRMTGLVSGMDTEGMIKELVAVQKTKNQKVVNKQTKLTWSQEKWKELNTKLYSLYTSQLSKMRLQGSYQTKAVTASDETKASIKASAGAAPGAHTLEVKQLARAQYVTGGVLAGEGITTSTTLTSLAGKSVAGEIITIKGKDITLSDTTTIDDFLTECRSAGLNANYDVNQKRFFISSQNSGASQAFTITGTNNLGGDVLGAMKLSAGTTDMTVVQPLDAKIILDGAELSGSTNSLTVNNLTIDLKDVTTQPITINVSNNTQATYDMVKDFVTKYNEVLKEMNTLYYASSASGYDPLTDEEKEKMSDSEVEKWETRIKGSLLRRDNTLGSILNSMKENMITPVTIDGNNFALSSFGISTSSDYSEKGLLHIMGDKDDAKFSTETNKLMEALQKDPEQVMQVLSKVSQNLYNTMTEKMSAIPNMRSALTFYNDKTMESQQTTYKEEISKLEKKLAEMEDRYYKQFAAMETALSKLQSQSDSLVSLLGN